MNRFIGSLALLPIAALPLGCDVGSIPPQADDPSILGAPLFEPDETAAAMTRFLDCMRVEDLHESEAYRIASFSTDQSPNHSCAVCHSEGSFGFAASPDPQKTLDLWRTPWVLDLVTFVVDEQGALRPILNPRIEAAGSGRTMHPTFDFDDLIDPRAWHGPEPTMREALEDFIARTWTRLDC